ncbi:hypothetical protein B5S28_g3855 [[Candida] boidinii]|uniref:Unnamed protein product n=1 Tax=Candida boidinii TaxID=5477 RepID=A0ACB5THU6_CANBO|nr:hypothetical protein B5S28_g3855 [[Candida] boidinii]OWB62829.1 hypothetical protein B5S29_g3776 [[Candida] boidinii]GME88527.1 unnamed protein product [[Candida] boidinii]GMF04534.1 unnamed protein product [[Candida] boidinii]GMF07039.1 unnamed protein product [[Candida] boidinii]
MQISIPIVIAIITSASVAQSGNSTIIGTGNYTISSYNNATIFPETQVLTVFTSEVYTGVATGYAVLTTTQITSTISSAESTGAAIGMAGSRPTYNSVFAIVVGGFIASFLLA